MGWKDTIRENSDEKSWKDTATEEEGGFHPFDTIVSAGYGAAQGLLGGFFDEILSTTEGGRKSLASLNKLRAEHPDAYKTGNFTGALRSKLFNLFKSPAVSAVVGGAIMGAGEAEGGLAEKAVGAGVGAGTSLGTLGVLKGAGAVGTRLSKTDLVKKLKRNVAHSFGDPLNYVSDKALKKSKGNAEKVYNDIVEDLGDTALKNDLVTLSSRDRYFKTLDTANEVGESIHSIYKNADKVLKNKKVIDKDKLVSYLKNKAKEALDEDKVSLFTKLNKRADMVKKSPKSSVTLTDGFIMKAEAGKRGYANQSSLVPKGDSAAVNRIEEKWYRDELKDVIKNNVGKESHDQLEKLNKQFVNLLDLGEMASTQVRQPSIAQQVLGNLTIGAAKAARSDIGAAGAAFATRGMGKGVMHPIMAKTRQAALNMNPVFGGARELVGATLRGASQLQKPAARISPLIFKTEN